MKKVPSYPKITANTNITVTQTQNININSPKAITIKKGFKAETKKARPVTATLKSESSSNLLNNDTKKSLQPVRKSSKKGLKQEKQIQNQKSIKALKSQRQLAFLSEKLKKLEEKINKIREKQKTDKNYSASHRSFSKNRENSYLKNEAISSRKDLDIAKKYHVVKAESTKQFKKSSLNKTQFESPPLPKKKSASKTKQKDQSRLTEGKQKNDQEILHQIVTQVPNKHTNLNQKPKQSQKRYALTPFSESEDQNEETELYYIGKVIKSLAKPSLFSVRQHVVQSLQTLQFLHNINKPTQKEIQKKTVPLPKPKFRQTVVLDLDQTLIHCNQTLTIPYDVKLSIKFPTGEKIDAGVNIRPHAQLFLQELSKICEVIVFTASHECYANVVIDYLDPKKQWISHRLFREHCWQTQQGVYIKDLRIMKNRELDNVILVDNAAYSYFFQLENGVPILPYYDDKNDKELVILLKYIKQLIVNGEKSSFRTSNQKYFRLPQYSKFEEISHLVEELYNTDSSSHADL